MTATNHFLIGVSISLLVKQPALALPLSFASHLAADALPHFGGRLPVKKLAKVWVVDAAVLLVALIVTWLTFGFYSVFIGFIATSPDLVWVYRMVVHEKFGQLPQRPKTGFNKFHSDIQKYEKPYNWPFEFVYVTLSTLFISSMR